MIVLDASFISKIILEEEDSELTLKLFREFMDMGRGIYTVDIALAEVLNALWKHYILIGDINRNELNEAIKDTIKLWGYLEKMDTSSVAEAAVEIASKYKITIYDSLYIATAIQHSGGLASYDTVMRNIAKKLGIEIYPKTI